MLAAAVGIGIAVFSGGDGHHDPDGPAFTPAPQGQFHLHPQVASNGTPPQPQLLTNGAARVLVAFGGVVRVGGRVEAALTLTVPSEFGKRTAGRYPVGASVTVGTARVRVLGVSENPETVDLQVTAA